ncbi:hypothetical protein AK88_00710 [Plasmodium fragile]|uniref:Uncharacterized protein n=1 Tax=Plasmodium fragile TaxID=5857 RepID=A0A0D9QTZ2_PLAFR|nr:uncharacterized protein AK88_00710 [Plasmodium fragile]KJP89501.1 hypothetical protein AK88_00710 [Plasmodium fragile]
MKNQEVALKPNYVKGRQEKKKDKQDDYTQNNIDFYNELRSALRTNVKNILKYESTKNEHMTSATQQKEEQEWNDKRMLRGQLKMFPQYDLKSLLSRDKKDYEIVELEQAAQPKEGKEKEKEKEKKEKEGIILIITHL